ncbi:MAG: hypothetical protein F4037_04545 [Gemmatimonadales bacterium]|nr:hypothetical protein [Candidatus Palauibacter ramosifaciens]
MFVEGGFERSVEEVFDGEGRGVVGAAGLPHARPVVKIHFAGTYFDLFAGFGREVGLGIGVHRQVRLSKRELALQQTLVDRSELADAERPKIHGAFGSFCRPVEKQRGKRPRELAVGKRQSRDPGSEL